MKEKKQIHTGLCITDDRIVATTAHIENKQNQSKIEKQKNCQIYFWQFFCFVTLSPFRSEGAKQINHPHSDMPPVK